MTERAHLPAPRRRPQHLRTLRLRQGLTQADLARRSGVSQPNISHLELVVPIGRVKATTRNQLAAALQLADPSLLRFGPDPQKARTLRRERRRFRATTEPPAVAAASTP